MASLWKHPQSRYFVACFIDKDGRRRKRSTKETDRKKAQRIADTYEQAARKKQTIRHVRKVISELHKEISGDEIVNITLRDHSQNWLAEKAGTAPATLAFYKGSLQKFLSFLGARADGDIGDVTSKMITEYRNELVTKVSPKTVNHDLKVVKALFKAARRDQLLLDDPSEFVDTVKARNPQKKRPFTLDEIRQLVAVADDEWKSMILFGLYTGLRLSDVAALRWSNIDLRKLMVSLRVRKTQKQILIPIAPPLAASLRGRTSERSNDPLHPQASRIWEREGRTGRLGNQFAELLVKAGMRAEGPKAEKGKGRKGKREAQELSFHSLRHTAVSLLKEAGIPVAVVMELAGHDSEQMSQHYTTVGDEAMKRAVEALPDVAG